MGGGATIGGMPGEMYGIGNCKKMGHQYQWVDEYQVYNNYPGQLNTASAVQQKTLQDIYGGKFVKHVFCSKCGDYRALELKAAKSLTRFHKMNQLKSG